MVRTLVILQCYRSDHKKLQRKRGCWWKTRRSSDVCWFWWTQGPTNIRSFTIQPYIELKISEHTLNLNTGDTHAHILLFSYGTGVLIPLSAYWRAQSWQISPFWPDHGPVSAHPSSGKASGPSAHTAAHWCAWTPCQGHEAKYPGLLESLCSRRKNCCKKYELASNLVRHNRCTVTRRQKLTINTIQNWGSKSNHFSLCGVWRICLD